MKPSSWVVVGHNGYLAGEVSTWPSWETVRVVSTWVKLPGLAARFPLKSAKELAKLVGGKVVKVV